MNEYLLLMTGEAACDYSSIGCGRTWKTLKAPSLKEARAKAYRILRRYKDAGIQEAILLEIAHSEGLNEELAAAERSRQRAIRQAELAAARQKIREAKETYQRLRGKPKKPPAPPPNPHQIHSKDGKGRWDGWWQYVFTPPATDETLSMLAGHAFPSGMLARHLVAAMNRATFDDLLNCFESPGARRLLEESLTQLPGTAARFHWLDRDWTFYVTRRDEIDDGFLLLNNHAAVEDQIPKRPCTIGPPPPRPDMM